MTRIVAGTAGGRALKVPSRGTRPTSDRVREAVFSRLDHLGAVEGARVLDLYAGSGALGLEAASRGASAVVLVDSGREAVDVARRNVRDLALEGVGVVRSKAETYVTTPAPAPWDLVLVDPPYDVTNADLEGVLAGLTPALAVDAVVVVERSARTPEPAWPAGWAMSSRDYGETRVYIGGPAEEPAGTPPIGGLPLPA